MLYFDKGDKTIENSKVTLPWVSEKPDVMHKQFAQLLLPLQWDQGLVIPQSPPPSIRHCV